MDEVSGSFPELPEIQAPQPLNQRIRQAREEVSQSIEGLALLLQLNPEYYEKLESGEITPDEELLKKICALFFFYLPGTDQRRKAFQFKRFSPWSKSTEKQKP
jgi:Helix-turn-helix.